MGYYDPMTGHVDFSGALKMLREGRRITRAGWNGRGMWIRIFDILDWDPFIVMHNTKGDLVPWTASQTDLLATDWVEVIEGN